MGKGVNRQGFDVNQLIVGNVVVPNDMDYSQCQSLFELNGYVSVLTAEGAFYPRVQVPNESKDNIRIPFAQNELGTLVGMFVLPRMSVPAIFCTYPDNNTIWEKSTPNSYEFTKQTADKLTSLRVDANNGQISLLVKGKAGSVAITVQDNENSGKYDLIVQGNASIQATKSVNITGNLTAGLQATDLEGKGTILAFDVQKGSTYTDIHENTVTMGENGITEAAKNKTETIEEKHAITAKEIAFEATANGTVKAAEKLLLEGKEIDLTEGASEPAVLGQTIIDLLTDLNTQISTLSTQTSAITVPVISIGAPSGPPINAPAIAAIAAQVSAITGQLQTALSKRVKLS